MKYSRQVGDWMRFRLGERVREREGRHEGTVEAILWGHEAKVKWDNGWISYVQLRDLERVRQ